MQYEFNATNQTMNTTYKFHWDSETSELTLHNRTHEEAIRIAKEFGWTEQCWYKPKTWGNRMYFWAE